MRQINLSEVNKQVKVVDGKLYFGNKEVQGCSFITENSIAALYVVRVKGSYWEFVTGFDLCGDKFWIGGFGLKLWKDGMRVSVPSAYYDRFESIEYLLNELCSDTAGKEWEIFEEEDFDAFDNIQNNEE